MTFQNCPIWSHCSQSGRILLARESWHFSIVFVYDIVSLQMKESFRAFSDFYAGSIHFKDVRHYSIISPYKKLGCFDWRHTTDVTHQASHDQYHTNNITQNTSHNISHNNNITKQKSHYRRHTKDVTQQASHDRTRRRCFNALWEEISKITFIKIFQRMFFAWKFHYFAFLQVQRHQNKFCFNLGDV